MPPIIDRRPNLHCPSCDATDYRDYDWDVPACITCTQCGAVYRVECVYLIEMVDPSEKEPTT